TLLYYVTIVKNFSLYYSADSLLSSQYMPQLQDTDIPVLSEEGNPVRISFSLWRDYKRYIYIMTNVLTGNRCRASGM
ncbi:TPA: hypothetical protein ACG31H_004427, partial [Escherichia coli]